MNNEVKESIYVGNAKKVGNDGFSIELNLTQLRAFLESAESKEHIRSYQGKNGENKTLKLVAWPLKQPQQYRSHSVKIDTWKPTNEGQAVKKEAQPEKAVEVGKDKLPF